MRLIDADAVNPREVIGGENEFANDIRQAMRDLIEQQPTVERPKGEWIEYKSRYDNRDHFYKCSECGRSINLICGAKLEDFPYCHCGAAMSEVGND